MQLKEPSFFLPLLGGRHQAATCRGANSTHHWLPFQQMCNLPEYRTEWGEMEAKAEQNKRNQHWPFALLKSLQWKVGMTPWSTQGVGGIMALWKCIRGEKSRLQAAAGNSVSGDLWAEVSRNPVRSLLNGRAVLARRSLFPPSSPAWARWAGARTFWRLSLIYLFDEK